VESPLRVLWLAGPALYAALGPLLAAGGISLMLPMQVQEAGTTLPDLVLLATDGGGAPALAELSRVNPGLSDVPVLRCPGTLSHLAGPALEVPAQVLVEAIHALLEHRPWASAVARSGAEQVLERMYRREMAAHIRSELAALRMERLVEVSAALSRSATPADVAAVVLTQGLKALYADTGYIAIRRGDVLEVVFLPGFTEEHMQRFRRVAMTARLPAVDCVLGRKIQIYTSPEELLARYPNLPSAAWAKTWAFLPMMADDHAVGALCLVYSEPTTFSEDDRRYMDLLARQCALALDRARLYEIEQDARKAREEALAIAAHDLRNPLSSIMLTASLLQRSEDEQVSRRARTIRMAAQRASELLRDLLDAAAIEHGRLRIQVEQCDGAALVRELREMFAVLAEEKRITLRTDCSGDVEAIAIDRARMHQALSNLLGNALKFTPAGGTIELRVEAHAGQTRFIVRDTGPGIDPEGVQRLFDRYWQARATSGTGVGLGLYIVKGIVEAHGGSIQVDTALGAGTAFIISIGAETKEGRCLPAAAAP